MSSDFIASFAVTGHARIHVSHPLFSVFVAHRYRLVAALAAAGNRCPAPSAVGVSVEGETTTQRAA